MFRNCVRFFLLSMLAHVSIVVTSYADDSGLHAADERIVMNKIRSYISEPIGRLEDWEGQNGKGKIVVDQAASSSNRGRPCSDLTSCADPCRAYEYTFVGTRKDGAVVNLERTARICLSSKGSWEYKTAEKTKSLTILNPAPVAKPEPVKPDPAEVARIAKQQAEADERERQRLAKVQQDQVRKQEQIRAAKERKDLVAQLQTNLKALYYEVGVADGDFGTQTHVALTAFLNDERSDIQLPSDPTTEKLGEVSTFLGSVMYRHSVSASCQNAATMYTACGFVN